MAKGKPVPVKGKKRGRGQVFRIVSDSHKTPFPDLPIAQKGSRGR
jgi:hypothetical protein